MKKFICLLILITSFGLTNCGYWMYYAYYFPSERIEEVKSRHHWHVHELINKDLPDLQNGLAVNFGMLLNYETEWKNRECFSAHTLGKQELVRIRISKILYIRHSRESGNPGLT